MPTLNNELLVDEECVGNRRVIGFFFLISHCNEQMSEHLIKATGNQLNIMNKKYLIWNDESSEQSLSWNHSLLTHI